MKLRTIAVLCLFAHLCDAQTVINGSRTILGNWDASGALSTKPLKAGTSLPATCSVSQMYYKTDATAGMGMYFCTSTNTWTQALGSGASQASDITDFKVTATGTTITHTGTSTTSKPTAVRVGGTTYTYSDGSGSSTTLATISGSGTGTVYVYIASNGTRTADTSSGTITITCSDTNWTCSNSGNVSAFPTGSLPVAEVAVAAGSVASVTDRRPMYSAQYVVSGSGLSGCESGTCAVDFALVPDYSTGTSAPPATCTAGRDWYIRTSTNQAYACTATNTYTEVTGGSDGVADPGNNGIMVRTALNTTIARSVVAGSSNISVSNADGTAGNITIDLAGNPVITGTVIAQHYSGPTGANLDIHAVDRTGGAGTAFGGTIRGGDQKTTATGVSGGMDVRAGNNTNAANSSNAGSLTLEGGDTNGVGSGGDALLRPGGSSNATPGSPGQLQVVQTFKAGATVTANNVQCFSANYTVADCSTSATNALGVATTTSNPILVQLAGLVTVNYDASSSPSAGWYACTSASTGGKVTVQSAACSAGRQVGIVANGGTSVTSGVIFLQAK